MKFSIDTNYNASNEAISTSINQRTNDIEGPMEMKLEPLNNGFIKVSVFIRGEVEDKYFTLSTHELVIMSGSKIMTEKLHYTIEAERPVAGKMLLYRLTKDEILTVISNLLRPFTKGEFEVEVDVKDLYNFKVLFGTPSSDYAQMGYPPITSLFD